MNSREIVAGIVRALDKGLLGDESTVKDVTIFGCEDGADPSDAGVDLVLEDGRNVTVRLEWTFAES